MPSLFSYNQPKRCSFECLSLLLLSCFFQCAFYQLCLSICFVFCIKVSRSLRITSKFVQGRRIMRWQVMTVLLHLLVKTRIYPLKVSSFRSQLQPEKRNKHSKRKKERLLKWAKIVFGWLHGAKMRFKLLYSNSSKYSTNSCSFQLNNNLQ